MRIVLHGRCGVMTLLAVSAVLVGSCAGRSGTDGADSSPGGAKVVASTTVWADVVSNVGCGEVDVATLVPAGVDSHSYELSVRDADELSGAALVVTNGLGLEIGLSETIDSVVGADTAVLELGPLLQPIEDGGEPDPHVWMDPDRVADAVPSIAGALIEADTGVGADRIEECSRDYVAELRTLSAELTETFDRMDPSLRNLVTDHAALGYLAQRYGLRVVGSVVESTNPLAEASARDMDELAATMDQLGIDRVLGEAGEAGEAAAALSERLGVKVVAVGLHTESIGSPGSGADSYVGMMRANGRLIAEQ